MLNSWFCHQVVTFAWFIFFFIYSCQNLQALVQDEVPTVKKNYSLAHSANWYCSFSICYVYIIVGFLHIVHMWEMQANEHWWTLLHSPYIFFWTGELKETKEKIKRLWVPSKNYILFRKDLIAMCLLCSKNISSNGERSQNFPLFGLQLEGSYSEAVIPVFTSCSLTFILAFLHILIGETPGDVLRLASAGPAVLSAVASRSNGNNAHPNPWRIPAPQI